ncbi:MAG: DUF4340 domain-containing protein, partial [Fimbriiglobus sp.]
MNFRLTAALFAGVLVLVVALLVTALTDGDGGADTGLAGPLTSVGLKEKDVTTVEIVRTKPAGPTVVLTRGTDGKWVMTAPAAAKVDGFAADALVRDIFQAKPVLAAGIPDNIGAADLDPATARVTLKAGDKTATVNLGLTTIGADKALTLVSTGERPKKVVAVPQRELAGLFRDEFRGKPGAAGEQLKGPGDFRSRRLLGADLTDPVRDLKSIKLAAGGKDVALTRDGTDWKFTIPAAFGLADTAGAPDPVPGVISGVRPLVTALTAIAAAGPADFLETPGDLGQYGLKPGDPAAVRIELVPNTGAPEVVILGKAVEDNGKPVTPAKWYARTEGDPAVAKVQADQADLIRKTAADPSELRNRDVLPESLRDTAVALDITVGGKVTKLRKVPVGKESRWVLYGGPGDPREANQQAAADTVTAITRPRLAREVLAGPNDAAFALAERKAEIKLWTAVEPGTGKAEAGKLPAEPAVKGPAVELVVGKVDGDAVFARRTADGKATDFKLPASMTAAAKTRLDFLDAKLPAFDPASVTTFRFTRGPETVELTKPAGPTGTWTFRQPARFAGKPADAGAVLSLLNALNASTPAKIVAEAPTVDELKKWGLDPAAPRLQVLVNELDYRFGGDTDDKLFTYAMQSGGTLVFTVPRVLTGRFVLDDLRDKTLYQIDPAKVTGLKIRGWKGP